MIDLSVLREILACLEASPSANRRLALAVLTARYGGLLEPR